MLRSYPPPRSGVAFVNQATCPRNSYFWQVSVSL
jgi:hypothetical protein